MGGRRGHRPTHAPSLVWFMIGFQITHSASGQTMMSARPAGGGAALAIASGLARAAHAWPLSG